MKRLIVSVACIILFVATSAFAAASSVTWSYAGSYEKGWIEITAAFTHSGTATFETTAIYLNEQEEAVGRVANLNGMYLYHVAYYFGSTAVTDDTDLEIRAHSATGYDILHGAGTNNLDAAANWNSKPWINGSESAMPIYGPLYLYINGNAVNSADGVIIMRFLPGAK